MSQKVKVSGTWKQVVQPWVKVAGTWKKVQNGFIKVGGVWRQWWVGQVTDAFTRTSSGGLGTSTNGISWTNLRGVVNWTANGTVATNSDTATNYPIAHVEMGAQDVTVSADLPQSTSGGTGVAFWVTDSGSWWAAYPYYTNSVGAYCYNPVTNQTSNAGWCATTNTYSVCDTGTCTSYGSGCGCGGCTTTDCLVTCNSTGVNVNDSCGNSWYCSFIVTNYKTNTKYTCVSSYSTHYDGYTSTGFTTTYKANIRIVSSVSGTVTTDSDTQVSSNTGSYPPIASIRVVTAGNQIQATAYASASLTSPYGTVATRTPASPNRGYSVGVVKAPGGDTQASQVDNFSATI